MTEPLGTKLVVLAAASTVPLIAQLPFDLWWLFFVPVGLVLGWGGRTAKLIQQQRPWSEVRRDALVSLLAGGINALLAGMIIVWFDLDYLGGLFCAALCGFEGVRAIETAIEWLRRHVLNDAAAAVARREAAQRVINENTRADMERLGIGPRHDGTDHADVSATIVPETKDHRS